MKMEKIDKWLIVGIGILLVLALMKYGGFIKFGEIVVKHPSGDWVKEVYITNPLVEKEVTTKLSVSYKIGFDYLGGYCYDGYARQIYPPVWVEAVVDNNLNNTKRAKLFEYETCTVSGGCEKIYTVSFDVSEIPKGVHEIKSYIFLPTGGCWIKTKDCGLQRVVMANWTSYGGTIGKCESLFSYLARMRWEDVVKDIENNRFKGLEEMRVEVFTNKFVICERGECVEPKVIEKTVEKEVEKPFIPTEIYLLIGVLILIILLLLLVIFLIKRGRI
jgi:hypothetical protein